MNRKKRLPLIFTLSSAIAFLLLSFVPGSFNTSNAQQSLSSDPLVSNVEPTRGVSDFYDLTDANIVYNFNELAPGAAFASLNYPYATFSTNYPGNLWIANQVSEYSTYRNYLSTTYPQYHFGVTAVNFNQAVRNLSFSTIGADGGGSFKIDLYQNNSFSQQIVISTNSCAGYTACFTDLRQYNNVTGIVIHTITDLDGLGFDDFSFTLGGTPTPTPTPNQTPTGSFDSIYGDGIAGGWAKDPDNPNSPIYVHFYLDGIAGSGKYLGVALANEYRSDVGNHAFNWRIPDKAPDGTLIRDGMQHTLFVHAIDLTPNSPNPLLPPTNGRTFTFSPRVQLVEFQAMVRCGNFNPVNGCLSGNPGNGNPNTNVGLRIFPDTANPDDQLNRRKVQVKATVGVANVPVYFRNLDVDDPSDSIAPVDDDSGVKIDLPDNRGTVNNSKAGLLSCPPNNVPIGICTPQTNGIRAVTDAGGTATAEFTVTIQPGDNFEVAASTDQTYADGIKVSGTQLRDASGQLLQIDSPSNLNARRTQMLTVWRELHLEVDSMGQVNFNYLIRTADASQTVGTSTVTILLDDTRKALEPNRFEGGRLVIGSTDLIIDGNNEYDIQVHARSGTVLVNAGQSFTLYDDDDFNSNDLITGVDGDNNEDVDELSQTFGLTRNSDSISENIFAAAYIRPEYNWALNYRNNDVTFKLNLPCDNETCVKPLVEEAKNTDQYERDDFWVGYILIAYQSILTQDADPISERPNSEITSTADSSDDTNDSSGVKVGAAGSLFFVETSRDWGQLVPIALKYPVPHGLGHQLGLTGDNLNYAFGVMNDDTQDPGGVQNPRFVPRHINILRWRVHSPGK